ncbi:MAG: hypothetical protein U0P30_12010 [Vicinamibacterales bacterium]
MRTRGGTVCQPDPATIMLDRADGGQLVVYPPRRVWDRTALTRDELVDWNLLVAATARAMLDALPQLAGGCINYWDAGTWALNSAAEPEGPKISRCIASCTCTSADAARVRPTATGRGASRRSSRRSRTASRGPAASRRSPPPSAWPSWAAPGTCCARDYAEADALGLDSRACGGCGYPSPAEDLTHDRCPACRQAAS